MKKGWPFFALMFGSVLGSFVMLSWFAMEPAFAAKAPKINAPKSFRAQFSYQAGGNPPEEGIMYFSHGRIREEVTPPGGGPKKVTIIDPMQKMIYQLDADKKAFTVIPWDARSALISEALRRFEKHELLDTKTIDGQECEDFEIRPKDPAIKPFYLFVNKVTRFPVQLTTVDPDPSKQIHIKWTNLTTGYQAAILFAPPMGYAELK
jgi:hypothetical protein